MTKTLLERFIVHRPHPWGALVTFIELLRNPKYEFWTKEFVRVAPEVTMLLERVSFFGFDRLSLIIAILDRWQGPFTRYLLFYRRYLLHISVLFY